MLASEQSDAAFTKLSQLFAAKEPCSTSARPDIESRVLVLMAGGFFSHAGRGTRARLIILFLLSCLRLDFALFLSR